MKKLLVLILLLPLFAKAQYCGPYTHVSNIVLNGASNMTISGDSINNNGSGIIGISLQNCHDIRITHTRILNTGHEVAIWAYNCYNITIDSCVITDVGAGLYAQNCPSGGIQFQHNYVRNVTRTVTGPGTKVHGQMVQFNAVGTTVRQNIVSYNSIENLDGQSDPEDHISMFNSNGTAVLQIEITQNLIRANNPPSTTGGGILLGDNGGSYQNCHNNIIVSPGDYGIGIAGGNHMSQTNNLVYSPAHPGHTVANVAMSFHNFTPLTGVCNLNVFTGNRVNWWSDRYYDGVHAYSAVNDVYNPGDCTTFGTNTVADASLNSSILPTVMAPTCTVASLVFGPLPTKIYGASDFAPGATSTHSITYTSATTSVATIVSGNIHIVGAGTSAITANDGVSSITQTLTVSKANLTVTAANKTKVYGLVNPTLTVTITGYVLGQTSSALTTVPSATTTATTFSNAGSYTITPTTGAATNYSFSYVSGTLTITKAALTITAQDKSKRHGEANPLLTATYSGFLGTDNGSNLTAQPIITTSATISSPVGTYPITVSGAASGNYTISYVSGTLTVNNALLTFNALADKTYGDFNFAPGASSLVPVTYTSGNTAVATIVSGQVHIVAAGSVNITANNGDTTITQPLTINKAVLTITADSKVKTVNTVNPALTASYSGFVLGETTAALTTLPTLTTPCLTDSPVAYYAIDADGAVAANYSFVYVEGILSVIAITTGTGPVVHGKKGQIKL